MNTSQKFREEMSQYPPMQQLPAQYTSDDEAITNASVILNFGLGVTYYQLMEFVNRRNIRAPWALDDLDPFLVL